MYNNETKEYRFPPKVRITFGFCVFHEFILKSLLVSGFVFFKAAKKQ
jgi:hypothetical protein